MSRIATYTQSLDIISRNTRIQEQLKNYQLQISTGVKYQNYKGYGVDSLRIQRYRNELGQIESFQRNIDIAQTRINQMDKSLEQVDDQVNHVLNSIRLAPIESSEFDLTSLRTIASAAREIVKEIINTKEGDTYLFAGTANNTAPLQNPDVSVGEIDNQMNLWLDGTNDTETFLSNLNSLTDSQLGYSTGVQTAGKIFVRADENLEVDYTVRANDESFKKVFVGLTVLSQMEFPEEGVDVASQDDFYDVINSIAATIKEGVDETRNARSMLSAATLLIGDASERHGLNEQTLLTNRDAIESANVEDAVIRFQALQTQLQATFQTTAILNELSLARILR